MKKYLILIFCVLLALSLLSCTASPTAVRVGSRKVDASEYAYYLHYSRLNLEMSSGVAPTAADLLTQAREQALRLIRNEELVRIRCDELGLTLTDGERLALKSEKEELVASFGGMAGYLEYLRANLLTDRLYDKLQENGYYYGKLYEHVVEGEREGLLSDQQLRRFYAETYAVARWFCVPYDFADEDGRSPQDVAAAYLAAVAAGETPFEAAQERCGGGEMPFSTLDEALDERAAVCLTLEEGETAGPMQLSDGWTVVMRAPADMMWFEENREQVEAAASDKAFNDELEAVAARVGVTVESVCGRIDFDNLQDYIK